MSAIPMADLTNAQLVAIFNQYSTKPVKRFEKRATAEQRVQQALDAASVSLDDALIALGIIEPATPADDAGVVLPGETIPADSVPQAEDLPAERRDDAAPDADDATDEDAADDDEQSAEAIMRRNAERLAVAPPPAPQAEPEAPAAANDDQPQGDAPDGAEDERSAEDGADDDEGGKQDVDPQDGDAGSARVSADALTCMTSGCCDVDGYMTRPMSFTRRYWKACVAELIAADMAEEVTAPEGAAGTCVDTATSRYRLTGAGRSQCRLILNRSGIKTMETHQRYVFTFEVTSISCPEVLGAEMARRLGMAVTVTNAETGAVLTVQNPVETTQPKATQPAAPKEAKPKAERAKKGEAGPFGLTGKKLDLFNMMTRSEGVTEKEGCEALGWAACGATIMRVAQAATGYTLDRSKDADKRTRYRLVPAATAAVAA